MDEDILAALSEYTLLSTDIMFDVLNYRNSEIASRLRLLEEFCCIERREAYFHITALSARLYEGTSALRGLPLGSRKLDRPCVRRWRIIPIVTTFQ
jgi:hypothetical protein